MGAPQLMRESLRDTATLGVRRDRYAMPLRKAMTAGVSERIKVKPLPIKSQLM